MNFINACKKMKNGSFMRRKAWKIHKDIESVYNPKTFEIEEKVYISTDYIEYSGDFFIHYTNFEQDSICIGNDYYPTMEDILATDWVEIK